MRTAARPARQSRKLRPPVKANPKTPGQLLLEAIAKLGLSKSEAGRRIGVPYYRVYRWGRDQEFTPQNRQRAALGLGFDKDAFNAPDVAAKREAEQRRVWAVFMSRPIAQAAAPEVIRALETFKFLDEKPRPTVAVYETLAVHLQGQMESSDIASVVDYNEQLDAELDAHRPTKPR